MRSHAGLIVILLTTLAACTPAEKGRDVTAVIEGRDRVAVGESVLFLAKLEYSDGAVLVTQPTANESVDWTSSNPGVAAVITMSGPDRMKGLVTGVSPGEAVIMATPSATTTGTGRRVPGTWRVTVVP